MDEHNNQLTGLPILFPIKNTTDVKLGSGVSATTKDE
jgi:hypothetical protein